MGSITGYTRRTANIGSGGGGGIVATLYSANGAILDISRFVTLYGNTASDKLTFRNQALTDILTINGSQGIDIFLKSTDTDSFKIYRGANIGATYNSRDRHFSINGSTFTTKAMLGVDSLDNGYAWLYGEDAILAAFSTSGTQRGFFGLNSNRGYLELRGTDDLRDIIFNAGSTCYFKNSTFTVGSNTAANATCLIDLISTTKGLGLPVMTTAQKNAISTPRTGLIVFDSTLATISTFNGTIWI